MADSSEASSSSASGTVVLSDLAAKRRKKYTAKRDKTKVSLFQQRFAKETKFKDRQGIGWCAVSVVMFSFLNPRSTSTF